MLNEQTAYALHKFISFGGLVGLLVIKDQNTLKPPSGDKFESKNSGHLLIVDTFTRSRWSPL